MLEANQIGWCLWPYKKMGTNPAVATKLGTNSAVATFRPPMYWDEITKFSEFHGTSADAEHRLAARPPKEHIIKALEGLLQYVDFDQCMINKVFLEALGFRDGTAERQKDRHQVRPPDNVGPKKAAVKAAHIFPLLLSIFHSTERMSWALTTFN